MIVRLLVIAVFLLFIGFMSFQFTGAFFTDTAVSAQNTFATAEVFPTPTGQEGSEVVSPGDVVINEIMWMGTQGDAADEWIELRNMTNSDIELTGWTIDNLQSGNSGPIIIPLATISASGYFLIANDPKETGAHNIDPDYVTASVSLANNGEQLILRTSVGGTIIDTANGTGDWLEGEEGQGQNPERSMERNDVPGDGTLSTSWHTATNPTNMDTDTREIATPRAQNSTP